MPGSNFSDNATANGGTVDHYLTNGSGNYILVRCTAANVPVATSGYAVGCKLQTTDTGVEFVNTGSTTSCAFVPVTVGQTTTASLGTTQNSTPTAAQLLGGIVTQTGATGAGTVTTPTGTVLSTAIPGVSVGYTFTTLFANLGGSETLTITAGASGMTIIGTAAVPSGKNAMLEFVNTAANTWDCYVRLSA